MEDGEGTSQERWHQAKRTKQVQYPRGTIGMYEINLRGIQREYGDQVCEAIIVSLSKEAALLSAARNSNQSRPSKVLAGGNKEPWLRRPEAPTTWSEGPFTFTMCIL